ncbi:nb-ARC domain protein, related [Neospora caninum Liverpool]|uniref:Nb-ARC domain protein, related n=1 Tax=Neospora caninum (strain Liverpool) TaxID=572307 RepID=F0V8L2_NEOCL|nr:nb-ARC domain protein, related [Neospora caninum Liverpool]CBZ50053.1 nb-ARC domain protein, related [Neospora caninum Liverpool]|eukprot:XP_003880088.1 nb-ARC domain protein, related [Neospora caninum Liverpool]
MDRRTVVERLLKSLDASQLGDIRHEFYAADNRVTVDEYVELMLSRMDGMSRDDQQRTQTSQDIFRRSNLSSSLPEHSAAFPAFASSSPNEASAPATADSLANSARDHRMFSRDAGDWAEGSAFSTDLTGRSISDCLSSPNARRDSASLSHIFEALTEAESEEKDFARERRNREAVPRLHELGERHEEVAALLIDVFDAIDTDGAGVISWEAFANALVNQGTAQDGSSGNASDVEQYQFVGSTTLTNSHDRIEKVVYIEEIDRLFCLYYKAKEFSVVEPLHGTLDLTVSVPSGSLVDLCYIPPYSQVASIDDDNLFASASADASILLWDATRSTPLRTLKGHKKGVFSLAFSTDFSCLLSAGLDKDALVWSPCNLTKPICHLQGHPYALCGVAVVPGTPQAVTADASGALRLWDLRNFRSLQTLGSRRETHRRRRAQRRSGNGGEGSAKSKWKEKANSRILPRDAETADLRHKEDTDRNWEGGRMSSYGEMSSFCVLPPHKRIATASSRVDFYELAGGQSRAAFCTEVQGCRDALFSPDVDAILTAGKDRIQTWSAETGLPGNVLHGGRAEITAISFDVRARLLYVGDASGNIRSFNALTGAFFQAFTKHPCDVCLLCFWPASSNFLSASSDGLVMLQEQDTDRAAVRSLDFLEPLSLLAVADQSGAISLWQPSSRTAPFSQWVCVYSWENLTRFNFLLLRERDSEGEIPESEDGDEPPDPALAFSPAKQAGGSIFSSASHLSPGTADADTPRRGEVTLASRGRKGPSSGSALAAQNGGNLQRGEDRIQSPETCWRLQSPTADFPGSDASAQCEPPSLLVPGTAQPFSADTTSSPKAENTPRTLAKLSASAPKGEDARAGLSVGGRGRTRGFAEEKKRSGRGELRPQCSIPGLCFTYRRKLKVDDAEDIVVPTAVTVVRFNTVQPDKTQIYSADEKGFVRCWSLEPLLAAGRLRKPPVGPRLPRRACASPSPFSSAGLGSILAEGKADGLSARLKRNRRDRVGVISSQIQQWEKRLLSEESYSSIDTTHSASTTALSSSRTTRQEATGDSSKDRALDPFPLSFEQAARRRQSDGEERRRAEGTEKAEAQGEREEEEGRGEREARGGEGDRRRRERPAGSEAEARQRQEEANVPLFKDPSCLSNLQPGAFITQLSRGGAAEGAGEDGGEGSNRQEEKKAEESGRRDTKLEGRQTAPGDRGSSPTQQMSPATRWGSRSPKPTAEVTLLWERAAHTDAILAMHVYGSSSLSQASSSSTPDIFPESLAPSCSAPAGDKACADVPLPQLPSVRYEKDRGGEEKAIGLGGARGDTYTSPACPSQDSKAPKKRDPDGFPRTAPAETETSPPPAGALSPSPGRPAGENNAAEKETPWLLTTGADKLVKTWYGDGAPLGKLSSDSTRYWTSLGNREAHWAQRLEQAKEMLSLLAERFFLQASSSSSASSFSWSSSPSSSARWPPAERQRNLSSAASSRNHPLSEEEWEAARRFEEVETREASQSLYTTRGKEGHIHTLK